MARLGQGIGDVWVRVHADGTGFDKELADELNKQGPAYDRAGKRIGGRMGEAGGVEFSKRFTKRLDAAFKRWDAQGPKRFKSIRDFGKDLRKELDESGVVLDRMPRKLKNLGAHWRQFTKDVRKTPKFLTLVGNQFDTLG